MTKRERCQAWIDGHTAHYEIILSDAQRDYSWTREQALAHVLGYLCWLDRNEHTKKGNYRKWDIALKRGLACQYKWENEKHGNRQAPVSNFDRTPGKYDL